MSNIDWLILAPAIPAIPVFATWYLPWERWIPWGKLPKAIAGPYALYLFFVAFHFDDNHRYWWLYYFLNNESQRVLRPILRRKNACDHHRHCDSPHPSRP